MEEELNRKVGNWVIITILIIILVGALCAFGGYKYADSKNTKQDSNNSEKKDDDKNESPQPVEEKESLAISIEKECGEGECHKNFEKTVNGVKYSISIDIKDAEKVEMGNVIETIKINNLTEEFTEIESISEIGILENGLVAIRTIPAYNGNYNTHYFDGNKLIETISSNVLDDYPITQTFGNYDECLVPGDEGYEEDEYEEDDDSNQRLKLYYFKINNNKTFSKTEIGTIENTFCTAQT